MKIIIAGCGKIGRTILSSLVAEGHDVVALDTDQKLIDEISNVHDVIAISGNCADCDVLSEAGIDQTDIFVAATESDELNMLACFLAKRMGAKHTIARIRKPEYNYSSLMFLRQQLDLSMAINPEMLAAQELYNILQFPSAVKIETFSRRDFEMIEIRLKPDSMLDGMSLFQMREKFKAKVLVCAVQRDDEVFIPDGSFVLRSGDKIGVTATPMEIQKLFKAIKYYQKKAHDIIIVGGSRIAYYLSKMLSTSGNSVKLIERDHDVCESFTHGIEKLTVVENDGTKQEVLIEEGIRDADAFVALTGMDEENILVSMTASTLNVPKVIAKISREELCPMAEKLGIDTIVSPHKIISDVLVRYARALGNSTGSNVETLYNLMDGKAEAIEFRVSPEFKMTGVPLKEMKLRKNILIAGIIRERKPIIPIGDDVILTGDRVIVLSTDHKLSDLSDILR